MISKKKQRPRKQGKDLKDQESRYVGEEKGRGKS